MFILRSPKRETSFDPETEDRALEFASVGSGRRRTTRRLRLGFIALLASGGSFVALASSAGASTVVPVEYAATGTTVGWVHCEESTGYANGATYAYLQDDPPAQVAAYTGTSFVIWESFVYEWVNGRWTYINELAWSRPGQYIHVGSSYDTSNWAGNLGVGTPNVSASPGHYYSVVNDTYWFNSASNIIASYSDPSEMALC